MKLGLVRRGYSSSGGAEAYLRRFATAAAGAGHEPVLFTSSAWPAADWPFALRRIEGGTSAWQFARQLRAARPEQECDLLFSLERVFACDVYRAGDGVHAAYLARRAAAEAPWRGWFRGWQPKHAALRALETALFAADGARLVIANSHLVQREIEQHFRYPAERIRVVYNGVPPALDLEERSELRAVARRELGLAPGDYVLLFAGSGWERKGLRYAMEAVDRAAGRPTLLIAGRGRQSGLPSSSRTRFLGPVSGLARELAAADIFLLPTLYDPFSNACLEAMAAGLPVITTAANGCAEILDPDEGGVVADPTDVAALSCEIERWSDPASRSAAEPSLREKGARFSVEENLRQTLGVLEEALAARLVKSA